MAKRKKRRKGEGWVCERKDGRFEYREMCGYREDGSRNIIRFYGKTEKEAWDKADQYHAQKRAGIVEVKKYKFQDFAQIWFNHHKRTVSDTTQEGYKYTMRILNEYFFNYTLDEIKSFSVENFLYELKDSGRSPSYISKCRAQLHQILDLAVANDLLLKNPVNYAQKIRSNELPKEKESFNAEEIERLMQELPLTKIGLSVRLLLGTGMRCQELLALTTDDIEPDGSEVRILKAVKRVKGTSVVGGPKSLKSYRHVVIPPNLRPYVIMLRNGAAGYIWESPRVKGHPCSHSHFADKFAEALEQIEGVRVLTPHCCRHTYVSQMQSLGIDIETIMSLVGHAEKDMTLHYLHVQRPVQDVAVAAFSDRFVPQLNTAN